MYQLAGKIYHDMSNYKLAVNAVDNAIELGIHNVQIEPNKTAELMYNKFELHEHLGNPDRKWLRRAHELDPDNVEIISDMLEYTKDKKELKRIGEIIKKIVKKEPNNIDNLDALTEYYFMMKETKKETQIVEKLHKIEPDNVHYLSRLLKLAISGQSKDLDG